MGLKDLYILSETIREKIDNEDLSKEISGKMEINMTFNPTIFYGIDKELYYLTHNNSYEGFVHSDVVNATINGIKFKIISEKKQETENI